MVSVSVVNCFEAVINRMTMLLDSKETNLGLAWNLVFWICLILQIMAIGWNTTISGNFWCYSETINWIFRNVPWFDILFSLNSDQHIRCAVNSIVIKILLCYMVSYLKMKPISSDHNYGIFCNVLFDKLNICHFNIIFDYIFDNVYYSWHRLIFTSNNKH